MALTDLTVTGLLDAFASSAPTPGGGSAAAMAGAMSASLLAMVATMTKTKSNTAEERSALDAAAAELLPLKAALTALIDADAAAYDMVVAAYRHPKGTDEEKAARKAAIQEAMRVATETPLDTMKACAALVQLQAIVAEHGNINAASDVHVAGLLARAALHGAKSNVDINIPGISDPSIAASLRAQADRFAIS